MLLVIGAIIVGALGTVCGISLGARVAKGGEFVWQPSIFMWAVGFHGLMGVLALVMVAKSIG